MVLVEPLVLHRDQSPLHGVVDLVLVDRDPVLVVQRRDRLAAGVGHRGDQGRRDVGEVGRSLVHGLARLVRHHTRCTHYREQDAGDEHPREQTEADELEQTVHFSHAPQGTRIRSGTDDSVCRKESLR